MTVRISVLIFSEFMHVSRSHYLGISFQDGKGNNTKHFFFWMLGIEPSTLHTLSLCSITEPYPWSPQTLFFVVFGELEFELKASQLQSRRSTT
jgi:hypothetical protein